MSQSTNDTYPSVMRLSILSKYKDLDKSLKKVEKAFEKKSIEFQDIIKT